MVPLKALVDSSSLPPPPPHPRLVFLATSLYHLSYCSEKAATVPKMQSNFGCEKHAMANSVTKTFRCPLPCCCPQITFVSGTGIMSLINYTSISNLKVSAKTAGGLINIRLKADSETNYFVTIKTQAVLKFEQSSLAA